MTEPLDLQDGNRNTRWLDWWSLTHLMWGILLPFLVAPFWALVILVLWEPLEVLVLSPTLARFGIEFGHESLRNSLLDIVVDVAGVLITTLILLPLSGATPLWGG